MSDKVYSREELKTLSDKELLKAIKNAWGVSEDDRIELWGEFIYERDHDDRITQSGVDKVKLFGTDKKVEYPLESKGDIRTISERGIHIIANNAKSLSESISNRQLIKCEADLAIPMEREKHDNPLLLTIIADSVIPLKELPMDGEADIQKIGEYAYITENYIRFLSGKYDEQFQERLEKEIEKNLPQELKKKETELISDIDEINQKKSVLISDYNQEIEKLKEDLIKKKTNLEKAKITFTKQDDKRKKLIGEVKELTQKEKKLEKSIKNIRKHLLEIEKEMISKVKRAQDFMREKADLLLGLEFIDEEEYNDLMMIQKKEEENVETLPFDTPVINKDIKNAVSYIQAYLFQKDIVYPKHIIEDFYSLVLTNDLIVLAGESGSGKTNLVKSFAEAVNGCAKIIPVKPNWTSKEDLLGYYNPLEKKYISTEFLDALFEAKNNPDKLYLICLDEMNLARVEYYFADFLSLLEERNEYPSISLYSDNESSHTLAEFKIVLELINTVKNKYTKKKLVSYTDLLEDLEVNKELKRIFGFNDKDSLIRYHSDLRRMLSGIINTPSSIVFPPNARIIGAINIDETTHYLSPKILDRAHVMRFDSPLLYDHSEISQEIEGFDNCDLALSIPVEEFGDRVPYPRFEREGEFEIQLSKFSKDYFNNLGIEVGLRTIRQGLNYINIFTKIHPNEKLALNNFFIHKILPKINLDGGKTVDDKITNLDLLAQLHSDLDQLFNDSLQATHCINAVEELHKLIGKAAHNDNIVNYWA